LTSPETAFRRLARHPKWLGACLLVLSLTVLSSIIRMPQELEWAEGAMVRGMQRLGLEGEELEEARRYIPDPENLTPREVLLQVLQTLGGAAVAFFLGALVFHGIRRSFGPGPWRLSWAVYWTAGIASALGDVVRASLMRASGTI
jgi:hypothetical protein